MGRDGHLSSIPVEATSLAATARRDLYVDVPACPGWQMADLVWHTGLALHQATAALPFQSGASDQAPPMSVWPEDAGLVDWLEEGSQLLVSALLQFDPDDTVGAPLIAEGYPGPSLRRHYAREVGLHRWDAQAIYGSPDPIPGGLAADWLHAMLMTWLPIAARGGRQAQGSWAGESIGFERTDAEGQWVVRLDGPGQVTSTTEPVPADVTARGSGGTLLLLAMNRIPITDPDLEIEGDIGVLERWADEVRYGRPAGGAHWFGSRRPTAGRGAAPGEA